MKLLIILQREETVKSKQLNIWGVHNNLKITHTNKKAARSQAQFISVRWLSQLVVLFKKLCLSAKTDFIHFLLEWEAYRAHVGGWQWPECTQLTDNPSGVTPNTGSRGMADSTWSSWDLNSVPNSGGYGSSSCLWFHGAKEPIWRSHMSDNRKLESRDLDAPL